MLDKDTGVPLSDSMSAVLQDQELNLSKKAHQGPCFMLAFANSPQHDALLATCGYDGYVKVWRQE